MLADTGTLGAALDWHLRTHPDAAALRLLHVAEGGDPASEAAAVECTYRELTAGAMAVSSGLQQGGLQAGDRVAIMLPPSRDYFVAFLGAMAAGAVVVPIYPPSRPAGLEDHLRRQAAILDNAQVGVLVTVPSSRLLAHLEASYVRSLRSVTSVEALAAAATGSVERPAIGPGSTVLLQYTSGSTGDPKGVILAHHHLLANIRAMALVAGVGPEDTFVSWLPLYHDMGLIGAWLGSLVAGFRLVVMPPQAFLTRPARWLHAIDEERATISAAPNVAFEPCLRAPAADLEGQDPSAWRLAFNGAEPVPPATVRRFTERFSRSGFRPETMLPVYGLAEAALGVTFPLPGQAPRIDVIERERFVRTGAARPCAGAAGAALEYVSCGRPLPGYEVRIVDAAGHEVADRQEGRIELTGPSATPGYFHDDATRRLRHGAWTDTGDLGYVAHGELYLTGRVKDIVIRAGQNLHPEEVEQAVGALSGVRTGCVVAFSGPDTELGTERLVVVAETRIKDPELLGALRQRVVAAAVDVLGSPPDVVVLAPPGAVLKTSSSKIRRAASRARFETGQIEAPPPATWHRLLRFAARGAAPFVRHAEQALRSGMQALALWALALGSASRPGCWCHGSPRTGRAGQRRAPPGGRSSRWPASPSRWMGPHRTGGTRPSWWPTTPASSTAWPSSSPRQRRCGSWPAASSPASASPVPSSGASAASSPTKGSRRAPATTWRALSTRWRRARCWPFSPRVRLPGRPGCVRCGSAPSSRRPPPGSRWCRSGSGEPVTSSGPARGSRAGGTSASPSAHR